MNKTLIGLLFILAGVCYGSLVIDDFYNITLGWLVKNNWVRPHAPEKVEPSLLGRKGTIIFYSLILIIIGIYLIWNRNI